MSIRFATPQDIPALVEGRRMHQLTRFKKFDYQGDKVAASFAQVIANSNTQGQQKYVFLVADDSQGAIVGALLAVLEKHIFSDQLTASIMHYDVLPEKRMGGYGVRLMKAFEQWRKNRKVVEIGFGINSVSHTDELARLASFACKLGYGKVGENYVRTL
jgi:GNAT superfamily N-acetyltransferase